MKSQISPGMIVGAIAAVVALVGCVYFFASKGEAGSLEGAKPPGMPASVQEEYQRRMGSATMTSPKSSPGASGMRTGTGPGSPPMMMTGPGGK